MIGYGAPEGDTDAWAEPDEVHERAPSDIPEPDKHEGQLRFAERFTRRYAQQFRCVHGIGWHEWDGARWAPCDDGAELRAVVHLVDAARREWAGMPGGSTEAKELLEDIRRVESNAGAHGVLDWASALLPISLAATYLDADPYLLNTRAGTVDLRTGTARPAHPADHLSKVTRAGFDPDATDDTFDQFLDRVQPDPTMRAFLARSLGAALLGQVRDHVLHIWYGTGANGKGTLRDVVRYTLADYAVEVPADILLQQKYGQQGLAPERMRLRGARVAFCSEIANGARLDEATMKKLTGGDPVNAKLLYRNPIEFDPSHTLIMLTNHLPQVRGDDPAVWRRILAVPFDIVVPADERDPELPERLKAAAPAVIAWLWRGWLDYQSQGLNPPAAVIEATPEYQEGSDLLARFLADETAVTDGHGTARSAELYDTFRNWCRAEGEEVQVTNKAFTEQMQMRGYKRTRTKNGALWSGLMIVNEDSNGQRVTGDG